MTALQTAILALLVFVVLYVISRASGDFSNLRSRTRSAQEDDLIDPSPRSSVKTAKFGARFHS
jgi:hypothetical protein